MNGSRLPAGWRHVQLGEIVCEGPANGYSPASGADAQGTLTLRLSATSQGVLILDQDTTKRVYETIPEDSPYWLDRGDLLVQRSNTLRLVGTAAIFDGPSKTYVYPDLMMRLRFGDAATTKWVWRYLNTAESRRYFEQIAGGSAGSMPKITGEKLKALPLPLPPPAERERIADILDKADAIRRKRKEAIALIEDLLRSTFLEMFGDPVTNPRGWPISSVLDLCENTQYGTAAKSNEQGHGTPVLRMNNITYDGRIDLQDIKWVELPPGEADKLTLRRGDVLFNRTNSVELVGKTAVWRDGPGYTFAGYLIRLRMKPKRVTGEYVATALNTVNAKRVLMSIAKPSINMANISGSDLARISIAVPPLDLQEKFSAVLDSTEGLRLHHQRAIEQGEILFQSLVDRAFRGELTKPTSASPAKAADRQLPLFE